VAVPPAVVTATSTAPALPEGVVTTIEPAVSEVTVPGLPPKVTELAEARLVPSMVTLVPPASDPSRARPSDGRGGRGTDVGEGPRISGRAAGRGDGDVDRTGTARGRGDDDRAGGVRGHRAGAAPKVTELAEARLVPSMVTLVPPAVGPEVGSTEVIVGAGTKYVKPPLSVAVPPAVVTTTSTVSGVAEAGAVTSIEVALPPVTVPATPPKVTEVGDDRFVPSMTTGSLY